MGMKNVICPSLHTNLTIGSTFVTHPSKPLGQLSSWHCVSKPSLASFRFRQSPGVNCCPAISHEDPFSLGIENVICPSLHTYLTHGSTFVTHPSVPLGQLSFRHCVCKPSLASFRFWQSPGLNCWPETSHWFPRLGSAPASCMYAGTSKIEKINAENFIAPSMVCKYDRSVVNEETKCMPTGSRICSL